MPLTQKNNVKVTLISTEFASDALNTVSMVSDVFLYLLKCSLKVQLEKKNSESMHTL